ncbi:acetylcholinesterase isoform X2 [Tetranychus urticae]|nr:acetylcholinesterase isoform X2 [Tetranychus urticae]
MVPLHDVVLVTHNYRLNAFGFMYFGDKEPRIPANIGLRDQLLALQWVKENIAKFGGDPDQVTIFGESAGSMSVSAHILSPLSKGLFKRAILESGTILNPKDDLDFFVRNALTVLNRTSCANTNDILKCLQGLPVSEIIDSQSDGILRFRWTFGDDFLPYTPMEVFSQGLFDNSFDLLLGNEKNEFSVFMTALDSKQFNPLTPAPLDYQKALIYLSLIFQRESLDFYRELYFGPYTNDSNYLRSQIEKAYSDSTLVCPTYIFGLKYALKANKSGGKVYGYYHTQKPASSIFKVCDVSPWMGTCHGAELPYVFGNPLVAPGYSQKDVDLSREIMKIWTHFAEFGYPPKVGGTEWKPLTEELSAMILNVDDLGKLEKSRIEFCHQQWEGFVSRGSLQLEYLLAAA